MLALEPAAQVPSSTTANPGYPEAGPYGVGEIDIGDGDARALITQPAFYEKTNFNILNGPLTYQVLDRIDSTLRLRVWFYDTIVDALTNWKFLFPQSNDTFKIQRGLHIAYPADPNDAAKLAGSGRVPVVVLVHGNHEYFDTQTGKKIPSHLGYLYLQKELASWGIVSVSVDTNVANALGQWIEMRAELALGALDALRTMDADAASPFHQRLDFANVGMMGHSRGGDAVVRAAILNAARPAATRYTVKAVCSLAPSDFTGTTSAQIHLDSQAAPFYAVLYGALDGDLAGDDGADDSAGTGFRHYDRAETEKSMLFFDACNHNRFNDVWDQDDDGMAAAQIGQLISRPDHRTLAKEYIGGLFRWHLLGTASLQSLFDGRTANSIGAKAAVQWSFGAPAVELDEFQVSGTAADGGTRTLTAGASLTTFSLAAAPADAVDGTSIAGRTNHQTRVLAVPPNTPANTAVYKLDLAPALRNWTGYDLFTFRVCADADVSTAAHTSDAALNPLPDFTIVFTDAAAASARIAAASLRTAKSPRLPVFHQSHRRIKSGSAVLDQITNCTVIRLETLAIDVTGLAGIDLADIRSVSLEVPGGFAKYQFFDSLQLIKR